MGEDDDLMTGQDENDYSSVATTETVTSDEIVTTTTIPGQPEIPTKKP